MITNEDRERRNEVRTGNRRWMRGGDGRKEGNMKQSETCKSNKDGRRPKGKKGEETTEITEREKKRRHKKKKEI